MILIYWALPETAMGGFRKEAKFQKRPMYPWRGYALTGNAALCLWPDTRPSGLVEGKSLTQW